MICTAATGQHVELLEITLPVLTAYARRHRFDLVDVRHDTAFGRPASWGKIPIIRGLLEAYELVVWVDADAIIVDLERDITEELRPAKDLYLVEHRNETDAAANAGVLMLRSGAWSRALLAAMWGSVERIDHHWWENAALLDLLGYSIDSHPWGIVRSTPWLERTRFIDVAWNTMPSQPWFAGPRAVVKHYGGWPHERRRSEMLRDLGQVVSQTGLAYPVAARIARGRRVGRFFDP